MNIQSGIGIIHVTQVGSDTIINIHRPLMTTPQPFIYTLQL